jgi:hypothetical protein
MSGIFILLITLLSSHANASEIYEDYISVRALGMGNAFSAVVDNKDALFYNPAGLDRIKGFHLVLMDPTLGSDGYTAYTTYQNAVGGGYAQLIQSFYGQELWVGIQDSLAIAVPDFAFAGYDAFNLSFNLHNPAYSNLDLSVTNDVGLVGGFAMNLLPSNALTLGFAAKRVTRYGGRVTFGPSTLATLVSTPLTSLSGNYGTGYGGDAGLNLQLPVAASPTFSAVWHNIGQTHFVQTSGTSALPALDNEIVFGFGMAIHFPATVIRPAVDFKHYNMWDEQLGKRLHAGLEIELPALSLRAGLNQGYYTLGVGIDFKYFLLDLATYGVELATYPGQLEDRRYVLQLTIDFNFDISLAGGAKQNGVSPSYYRR